MSSWINLVFCGLSRTLALWPKEHRTNVTEYALYRSCRWAPNNLMILFRMPAGVTIEPEIEPGVGLH